MNMSNRLFLFLLLITIISSPFQSYSEVPATPTLLSVSVINAEGHVKLTWFQADANSVTHYEINRWENVYQVVSVNTSDVVISNDTVVWTDNAAVANTQRSMYQIISFIGSEKSTPSNESPTIYQKETDEINLCERQISLFWSEYGIENPVTKYRVHYSASGGQNNYVEVITSTLEIIEQSTAIGNTSYKAPVYKYALSGLNPAVNYRFWIEALHENADKWPAFSNIRENYLDAIPQPAAPLVEYITVNEANAIEIYASIIPEHSEVIRVERALDENLSSERYQFQLPVSQAMPLLDEQAAPSAHSYYYAVSLLDQCQQAITSNIKHRSILLEGSRDNANHLNLNWNNYEGWATDHFELWRQQGSASWEKIASPTAQSVNWQVDLSMLQSMEASINYKLIAVGTSYQSQSNILRIQLDYTPLLPNAFNPQSEVEENTVFKPISDFYNSDGYRFMIYDRWGGLLWESTNPSVGWTGRDQNGMLYERGVYVYLLFYKDQTDRLHQLNNTFTLLY